MSAAHFLLVPSAVALCLALTTPTVAGEADLGTEGLPLAVQIVDVNWGRGPSWSQTRKDVHTFFSRSNVSAGPGPGPRRGMSGGMRSIDDGSGPSEHTGEDISKSILSPLPSVIETLHPPQEGPVIRNATPDGVLGCSMPCEGPTSVEGPHSEWPHPEEDKSDSAKPPPGFGLPEITD